MRRGCKIIFIIKDNQKIETLKSFLMKWHIRSNIFELDSKVKNINTFIKNIATKRNCDAIIMGNTIFHDPQLSNIQSLKKDTDLPILYPLIAMDENEISQKCKEIGISP